MIFNYDDSSIKLSELLKNNYEYEIIGFVVDSEKLYKVDIAQLSVYKISDMDKIIIQKRLMKYLLLNVRKIKKIFCRR